MVSNYLRAVALAAPIVITAMAPDIAEACPVDHCDYEDFWGSFEP